MKKICLLCGILVAALGCGPDFFDFGWNMPDDIGHDGDAASTDALDSGQTADGSIVDEDAVELDADVLIADAAEVSPDVFSDTARDTVMTDTARDTFTPVDVPADHGTDSGMPDTSVPPTDTGHDTGTADTMTCPPVTSLQIRWDRTGGIPRFAAMFVKVFEADGFTVISDWTNRCVGGLADVTGMPIWLGCTLDTTGLPWGASGFTRRVFVEVVAANRISGSMITDPACPDPDPMMVCPPTYTGRYAFDYGCSYTLPTTPMSVQEYSEPEMHQWSVRFRTP